MKEIIELINLFYEYFVYTVDLFLGFEYYFLYIPFLFLVFWFFETFAFTWYLIPMEVIIIWVTALIVDHNYLIIFSWLVLYIWVFVWLIVWYFFWNYFFKWTIQTLEKNYPTLKQYFQDIDYKMSRYHFWSFPILINVWFLRPLLSVHLWARWYNFKKFVLWSILWTFFYVIPRIIIWIFLGYFWKIIIEYATIWYQFFIVIIFLIILFAFFIDFKKFKKNFKN